MRGRMTEDEGQMTEDGQEENIESPFSRGQVSNKEYRIMKG